MSQAPQAHTPAPPVPPGPSGPAAHAMRETGDPKLAAMADKLDALRHRLASTLDPDALAELQAAVVELASLGGKPPGLSQPVPDPKPAAAPPGAAVNPGVAPAAHAPPR